MFTAALHRPHEKDGAIMNPVIYSYMVGRRIVGLAIQFVFLKALI